MDVLFFDDLIWIIAGVLTARIHKIHYGHEYYRHMVFWCPSHLLWNFKAKDPLQLGKS